MGVVSFDRTDVPYRRFTTRAVRRCIVQWRAFDPSRVRRMMEDAEIPLEDRNEVLDFVERSFRSVTPGNAIVYGLKPEALEGLGDETP